MNETKIYDILDKLNVEYDVVEHESCIYSRAISHFRWNNKGCQCKNLFLRNAKGNKYYLL
ncbi:hypothetical protein [Clostridioides difficile]|uniref:hypothetical protein n=1 Tax=Clostridioides difficile TaxID=1496 RepID=UPI001F37CBA9|nr:hypothetical protein [Clostridioides difficile]